MRPPSSRLRLSRIGLSASSSPAEADPSSPASVITPVRALAALASVLLAACITGGDKQAGVDEFPNTVYARVHGFLDEGKKAEDIGTPSLGDSLSLGTGIPVAAESAAAARKLSAAPAGPARQGLPAAAGALGKIGSLGSIEALGALEALEAIGTREEPGASGTPAAQGGLGKGAAEGCTAGALTTSQLRDSAQVGGDTLYVADTTVICLDAKALDDISGNETILRLKHIAAFKNGRIETAEISDADGDGILNPVAGAEVRAALILSSLRDGVLERTELVAGPGPDGNFDTEADNLVYSARWWRTSADGADTLARATYADGDSDGVAIDNGKASVVDLDLYEKGPTADHPDAVWSRTRLRLVVRYGVASKQARKLLFEMEDDRGRLSTSRILALDGGGEFAMGDTVTAEFLTVGTAEGDSLDSMRVRLTMNLGSDFDDKADDSVYAMHVVSVRKLGDERRAEFGFASSRPLPSGGKPADGTVSMSIDYRDGTRLSVGGRLAERFLDVEIEDRAGNRAHAVWDPDGKGVLYEKTE